MSYTPIDEWKNIAAYHRTALEKAESHIKELEELETPSEFLIPGQEMEERVIAMERRPAYKFDWKRVVTKENLVRNVENILNDCYDFLCDKEESGVENIEEMGAKYSRKRQLFTLKVIQYLRAKGSFHDEYTRNFDSFEDTAGGCDEVTQEAAIFLLNNPDWKPTS
jgi:hypothetical protein